jgi:alpha-D-ribose 1-methylphosphonate 5-phosphate C-P lyase
MARQFIIAFLMLGIAAAEPQKTESAFYFHFDRADQTSSAAVEDARRAGTEQASVDIAAGEFQIVVYGEPVPEPIPPVVPRDSETNYAILRLHDCTPTPAFEAHVAAYNSTMRRWHAEHTKHSNTNQSLQRTAAAPTPRKRL